MPYHKALNQPGSRLCLWFTSPTQPYNQPKVYEGSFKVTNDLSPGYVKCKLFKNHVSHEFRDTDIFLFNLNIIL